MLDKKIVLEKEEQATIWEKIFAILHKQQRNCIQIIYFFKKKK